MTATVQKENLSLLGIQPGSSDVFNSRLHSTNFTAHPDE